MDESKRPFLFDVCYPGKILPQIFGENVEPDLREHLLGRSRHKNEYYYKLKLPRELNEDTPELIEDAYFEHFFWEWIIQHHEREIEPFFKQQLSQLEGDHFDRLIDTMRFYLESPQFDFEEHYRSLTNEREIIEHDLEEGIPFEVNPDYYHESEEFIYKEKRDLALKLLYDDNFLDGLRRSPSKYKFLEGHKKFYESWKRLIHKDSSKAFEKFLHGIEPDSPIFIDGPKNEFIYFFFIAQFKNILACSREYVSFVIDLGKFKMHESYSEKKDSRVKDVTISGKPVSKVKYHFNLVEIELAKKNSGITLSEANDINGFKKNYEVLYKFMIAK